MFTNFDSLPPGQHLFTVYVGMPDINNEVDVAVEAKSNPAAQVQAVMAAAQAELAQYSPLDVFIITDQSDGEVVFNAAWPAYRPLPIFPHPVRLDLGSNDVGQWHYLTSLMSDNFDGANTEYLDYLLGVSK